MPFDTDLVNAKSIEEIILEKIKVKYPNAKLMEGYFPDYDIYVNERITIEIKHDIKSFETGNIAIEISYNGNPSGICSTKAKYWIIVINSICYLIETTWLRLLTYNHQVVSGGDNAQMVLISVTQFINYNYTKRLFSINEQL